MERKCKNCQKWDAQAYPSGFCKAKAPQPTVVKGDAKDTYIIVWPSTGADDWCWDFEMCSSETCQTIHTSSMKSTEGNDYTPIM